MIVLFVLYIYVQTKDKEERREGDSTICHTLSVGVENLKNRLLKTKSENASNVMSLTHSKGSVRNVTQVKHSTLSTVTSCFANVPVCQRSVY